VKDLIQSIFTQKSLGLNGRSLKIACFDDKRSVAAPVRSVWQGIMGRDLAPGLGGREKNFVDQIFR